MQPKHLFWATLAVVVVVGAIAWLALAPKQATAPSQTSTSTPSTASTTTTGGLTVSGSGATVTETSTGMVKSPATPALAFSADLDADAKQALQTQWNTLTGQLKSTPTRVDLWLELGVVYKIAGQYDAAVAAWSYVAKAGPNSINYVAYGNLGDLYLNFTHDYAKAAASYKAALSVQPNNPDYQAGYKAAQSHL